MTLALATADKTVMQKSTPVRQKLRKNSHGSFYVVPLSSISKETILIISVIVVFKESGF